MQKSITRVSKVSHDMGGPRHICLRVDNIDEAFNALKNKEVKLISDELVDVVDFEKVKNKIEANIIFSKLSVLTKAMNLGYYELLGDAHMWDKELEIYRSISRDDIRNTASSIFQLKHQNILMYNKQVKQYPSRKSGVRQLAVPRL